MAVVPRRATWRPLARRTEQWHTDAARGRFPTRFAGRGTQWLVAAFAVLVLAGCEGGISAETREKFKRFTPAQNYDIALHDENADARRRAIVRIVNSGHATSDDAFRVLDVAARTDPNAQVRCAAIRALATYKDPRPVDGILAVLNAGKHPDQVVASTTAVRWDAAEALERFCDRGLVPPDRLADAADTFVGLLLHDPSRDVKMTAARGLGSLADARVLRPLIASLRYKDFGVAYEARNALVRLTGQPHEYDADAWEAWLKAAPDPFSRTEPVASQPATAGAAP